VYSKILSKKQVQKAYEEGLDEQASVASQASMQLPPLIAADEAADETDETLAQMRRQREIEMIRRLQRQRAAAEEEGKEEEEEEVASPAAAAAPAPKYFRKLTQAGNVALWNQDNYDEFIEYTRQFKYESDFNAVARRLGRLIKGEVKGKPKMNAEEAMQDMIDDDWQPR
jgi:hypothetical protein